MVGIERNKDPELSPKERNTSYFVLLDDRKHGRAGKFPVFYDIDTGDYLEPPEGFLDSEYQTLKEWYNLHPKQPETEVEGVKDLSSENQENHHYTDLTEENIPQDEDNLEAIEELTTALGVASEAEPQEIGQVYTGLDDEDPPFAPIGLQYARHMIHAL